MPGQGDVSTAWRSPSIRVAGHIPGAHCRPFQENLDARGRFRAASELRERFAGLDDKRGLLLRFRGYGCPQRAGHAPGRFR